MKHALDTNIAKQYGVNIALLLESFQFWTFKNLARKKHIYDGLCWSYDTLESLGEIFDYWTRRQIEHTINNAVKHGLLVKGNYNQTKYDRTVWYALTPKAYEFFPDLYQEKYLELLYSSISQNCEIDYTNFRNGFPKNVTPIPVTTPVTDPYINNIAANIDNQALGELGKKGSQEPTDLDTKSDYRKNQTKKNTVLQKKDQFDINHILQVNPFQIPEEIIRDWIENRKKKRVPVTKTAWNKINKEFVKCKEKNIDPIEAFETMVASGWQSLKVEYFEKQNKPSSQWDIDSVMRA